MAAPGAVVQARAAGAGPTLAQQPRGAPRRRGGALRLSAQGRSSNSLSPFAATQPAASGGVGDKLLPLLRSPFDLLALGPRVTLGALQSLPEVLEKLCVGLGGAWQRVCRRCNRRCDRRLRPPAIAAAPAQPLLLRGAACRLLPLCRRRRMSHARLCRSAADVAPLLPRRLHAAQPGGR